jgi:hypothetical protein
LSFAHASHPAELWLKSASRSGPLESSASATRDLRERSGRTVDVMRAAVEAVALLVLLVGAVRRATTCNFPRDDAWTDPSVKRRRR